MKEVKSVFYFLTQFMPFATSSVCHAKVQYSSLQTGCLHKTFQSSLQRCGHFGRGWLRQISRSLFKTAFTLKGSQMQNVLISATAAPTASTTISFADNAVVKNDTSTTSKSKPSIILDTRSKVSVAKTTTALTPIGRLQSM